MQEKIKTRWVWNEKLQEHQMVEYGTGKYSFTEEDKISIVSEYVCGHVPASVLTNAASTDILKSQRKKMKIELTD
jgi:hypothetical protein